MLGRKIAALALLGALSSGVQVQAQDQLSTYDPNNYSGGYAEGIYAPMGDEQLYPFDSQDQWQHGYIQYMPFYGAYEHFRPYNYKHVSAQAQAAAGWGMSARMPYSQQFWHRYHAHSKMGHPASGAYENYLDIPVPKKARPEHQEEIYEEDLQLTPQPTNPPQLTSPLESNSVRYAPRMSPPANGHAGVSYQQMQQPQMQQTPMQQHQTQQWLNPQAGIPSGQAPRQAHLMIPGQGSQAYSPMPAQPVLTLPPTQPMVPGSQPVLRVP